MPSYRKNEDLLGKIQKRGKVEPLLNSEGKEQGFFSVTVTPPNVKFVTDLLDFEIGTWNYDIKYNAAMVNWTIKFHANGKPIKELLTQK